MWEIMPYVVLKGSQSKKQISLRTSGGEINGEVLPGVNLKTDKMYIFFLKRKENPFIWETVNAEELSIRPVKVIEFTIIDTVIKFKDSELVKALDNYINNNDLSKYKIKEVNNIGWKQ
jgi:Icc-related predicted phosphoesterase